MPPMKRRMAVALSALLLLSACGGGDGGNGPGGNDGNGNENGADGGGGNGGNGNGGIEGVSLREGSVTIAAGGTVAVLPFRSGVVDPETGAVQLEYASQAGHALSLRTSDKAGNDPKVTLVLDEEDFDTSRGCEVTLSRADETGVEGELDCAGRGKRRAQGAFDALP